MDRFTFDFSARPSVNDSGWLDGANSIFSLSISVLSTSVCLFHYLCTPFLLRYLYLSCCPAMGFDFFVSHGVVFPKQTSPATCVFTLFTRVYVLRSVGCLVLCVSCNLYVCVNMCIIRVECLLCYMVACVSVIVSTPCLELMEASLSFGVFVVCIPVHIYPRVPVPSVFPWSHG